ncbi:MAG TPA: SRPBCC domain-containing protein [Longimicrobiales bacterium]|nr:SRPBCC domain-containing protein [Longimicrobiales bacterium]
MKTKSGEMFRMKVERRIRAPRERVFEAWTRAEELKRWSAPEGMTIPETEVDLRVGGRFRIAMQEPEGGARHVAVGTYREVTPPSRLVYTWAWLPEGGDEPGDAPQETVIIVDFEKDGDGTRVVMVHEGFVTEADRDKHEQGWTSSLNRLEAMFAG